MSTRRLHRMLARGLAVTVLGTVAACTPSDPPDPAPTTPVAPADYLLVSRAEEMSGFTEVITWDPADASLVGPTVAIAFDAMATTTTLSADQTAGHRAENGTELVAASGYEFLVLHYLDQHRSRDPGSDVRLTFVAGEHRVDVSDVDLRDHIVPWSGTVIVSVPAGAPVALVLEDAGRSQTLDLRTGQRGPDAIADYYPIRTAEAGYVQAYVTSELGLALLQSNSISARLLPYSDGDWAAPGRLWLVVSFELTSTFPLAYTMTLDVDASFRINEFPLPDKEFILYPDALPIPDSARLLRLRLDVPADLTSATVTFAPQGTVRAHMSGPDLPLTIVSRSSPVILTFPAP